MEFGLHQRLYGKQDGTINVIEQVERGEED